MPFYLYFIIQCKFVASTSTSKDGTHKQFGRWLKDNYANGQPSQSEVQAVVDEDAACNYNQPIEQDVPFVDYPDTEEQGNSLDG